MDLTPLGRTPRATVTPATQGADPAMVKAAQEFESIFVRQLVKAMRQASNATDSGILSGKKTRVYQDMLDEEMARALAQHGGLGVADFVMRDMSRRKAVDPKKDSSAPPDVPIVPSEASGLPGGAR